MSNKPETAMCDKHGEYIVEYFDHPIEGHAPIKRSCKQCSAEHEAKRRKEEEREKQYQRNQKINRLIERSGIPLRFIQSSFEDYVVKTENAGQTLALAVCKKFAHEFCADGRSLILSGSPGAGKTHLATAIMLHVIQELAIATRFMTTAQMLREIKSSYSPNFARSEAEIIAEICAYDLLVLDEVGVQIGSEHEKMLMFEILNDRYQNLKSTILISNLSMDELEEFMGERVMDRYRECGAVIPFNWASARGVKL